MNINALSAMTGIPAGKKGTHRGRRSRGKSKGSPSTNTHLSAINASMAAGDHASAKKSALMLANALHKSAKGKGAPDTVSQIDPESSEGASY